MFEDHLKDGAKVLDIGSGSGYLTACFAVMAGPNAKVIGVDHIQELVDWSEKNIRKNNSNLIDSGRIKLVVGDGHFGFEEEGPYHVIHVGAADSGIPQSVRFYDSKSDIINRGVGTRFFPVKHEKFPPSYIQDVKNFSVLKPLNSGEALASLASPVPPPLFMLVLSKMLN